MDVDKQSPEKSGFLAANNGFALVETAFVPVSLRIRPDFVWLIAVAFLVAVAASAGLIVASDLPATASVQEVPAVAAAGLTALVSLDGLPSVEEGISRVAGLSTEERTASKELRIELVVLRGQPPSTLGRRVLAFPSEPGPRLAGAHMP